MHSTHHCHVLQLDIQGTPQAWITLEQAALHVATGSVAWVDGDGPLARLRGGNNVARGCQSIIEIHPITALAGRPTVNLFDVVPTFTRAKLFRGDRMTCACCGQRCTEHTLEEAAMPLLYLPYVPSRFEDFLLEGRHIRAPLPSHPSPPSATATALQGALARRAPGLGGRTGGHPGVGKEKPRQLPGLKASLL